MTLFLNFSLNRQYICRKTNQDFDGKNFDLQRKLMKLSELLDDFFHFLRKVSLLDQMNFELLAVYQQLLLSMSISETFFCVWVS